MSGLQPTLFYLRGANIAPEGGEWGLDWIGLGLGLGLGASCALPSAFCPVATPYIRPPASGSLVRYIEPKSCSIWLTGNE